MEPFDSIEKWITEHGSAAIMRDHLALLKEQMAAKDTRIRELSDSLIRITRERDSYKQQAERFSEKQPGDRCPYCRQLTGALEEIKPHMFLGPAGLKVGHYKCGSCGKKYEKDIKD